MACIQFLDNGLAIPHSQMFAQVVSSQAGIEHFKLMTKKRTTKFSDEEFQSYINVEKLVLLDGQQTYAEIQEEFNKQLINLNLAWALKQ